jgi:hypothetical protein
MADVPGGASGLLVRDYKGKKADRLVVRIDPGVASLVAELRGHEWQAAEELQKRWDRQRAGRDLILDQRGADMADLPGGASGLLMRGYKGKKADRLVTRIDPGVVSLVAELRGHERQAAEKLGQWKARV